MTLALYGKTRRRRAGLLLAGLMAVVIGTITGLFALTAGDATACACEDVSVQIHKYLPKGNVNNPWENQGASAGSWKFTVYEDNAGTPGNVLVANLDDLTPSAGFPQQDILIKETNTDGDVFFGWFKPDGDGENSGNDKCNQAAADFTTGGKYSREEYLAIPATAFGTPGNLTGLLHICAYDQPVVTNRNVEVCKVVVGNGDGTVVPGFSYGFDIRPDGASNISGSNNASEPAPDMTDGANGTEVCATKQVPVDKAFDVVEWMSRPAGWTDDPDYPKYSINGVAQVENNTTTQIPSGVSDVKVTFFNKAVDVTRTIAVCKVVVDNNDGTVDGGKFAFAYDWKVLPTGQLFVGDAAAPVEGGNAVCASFTAPVDKAVRIIEVNQRPGGSVQLPGSWNGDDPLYPQNSYDGLGAKDNSVELPVGVNTVTFYNKTLPRTKQIVIEKHYVNLGSYTPVAGDLPAFTLTPDPFDGIGDYSVGLDHCTLDAGGIKWTCTVPAAWIGTAAETLQPGWRESEGLCEATNNPVGLEHFAFCNEPYGTIRIEKFDSVNGTTGPLWDFTVGGNFAAPGGAPYSNPAQADQDAPFVSLPVGLSNTPVTVAEVLAQSITACATANTYYTIVSPPADTVVNTPGEVQTWTFENAACGTLGTGGLVIEKYLDINGDGDANDPGEGPLSDWTFTTTGGDIAAGDQVHQTDTNGQILGYTGFDAGTVLTTTESAVAGYTLTRVTLDGANVGTNASNDVVIVGGETRIIRYYNHPLGSISVHKTTRVNSDGAIEATPDDDDGWQFTLTSVACGINTVRTTNEAGNATFNNLPLCSDYVVTENLAVVGAAGYTPVGLTTVVNVTPGIGTATFVTFVNEKPGFIPFVVPTPNPTATPTTKPEEPTITTVPPTATPTQTGIVAGEKTPGPASPTPIVPSTGNGVDRGANLNLAFIIVGLFAVTTGLGAFALRTNRRR